MNFSNVKKINPLFSKSSVRVLYTGLNRNNSFFSKEVVEKNIYSMFGIPIVGEYFDDVENFGGHGGKIEVKDDSVEWVHTTLPYGHVPESATIYWEEVTEENGDVNEYLVVDDALLWTGRYPEVEQLIGQSFGQSMEIDIVSGKFKKINGKDVYVVEDFVFSALCILGINKDSDPDGNVEPCFESASIIAYTIDKDEFMVEYKEMLDEIKQFNLDSTSLEVNHIDSQDSQQSNESQIELQGGDTVDKILEMLAKYNLTLEDLQAKEINHEDFSLEDLEEKVKAEFTQVDDNKDIVDNPADNFSLTVSQLQEEVYRALEDFGTVVDADWGYEYSKYSLADIDTESSIVVAYDNENWYLVGFNYSVEGDRVSIDKESLRRFKVNYVPMELEVEDITNVFDVAKSRFEKAVEAFSTKVGELTVKETSLQELQAEHDTLKTEYAEVSAEYSAKLQSEREQAEEEIFATFAKELTEDEMSEVKAKKDEMELEDIQDKLFALVGKKKAQFNFTKAKANKVITIAETEPEKPVLTGKSYDVLIEKYSQQ